MCIRDRSTAGLASGLGGLLGAKPQGVAQAEQIQKIRESVPFDAENQSEYYTKLGQQLINQGLTQAGAQALELAKKARLDEAKIVKAEADGTKLTGKDKDRVAKAVESSRESAMRAEDALDIAKRYAAERPTAGWMGTAYGAMKKFVGGEDEIDLLRQEYKRLRISDGLSSLPPGAASDKDVELAMSKFPDETSDPAYIASFLEGIAKRAAIDAEFQKFYAKFVEENKGKTANALDAWDEYKDTIDFESKYGFTWNPKEAEKMSGEAPKTTTVPQVGGTVTIGNKTIKRVQ